MKIKKTVAALLACACILPMAALTACGEGGGNDDEPPNPPGVTTYTFEAEGVDLTEQSGRGWSNEAAGCKMIQGQNIASIRNNATVLKSISNGYFVGFFGIEGTTFEFNINSSAAEDDATLVLRLASEWGTMTVDNTIMRVYVNDEEINYTPFTVTGTKITDGAIKYGAPFKDFTVSTSMKLKVGENTVKLVAQGKTYGDKAIPMGPGVDCIKIKSKAELTWDSLWNENKDNIIVEK